MPLLIDSKGHGICICRASSSHFILFLKWVNSLSLPHFEISFAIVFCFLIYITLYTATFFLIVIISFPHLFIFCAKDLNLCILLMSLYATYTLCCIRNVFVSIRQNYKNVFSLQDISNSG